MSAGLITLVKLALIAVVVVLGLNPRWPLARFMFRSRGPRSDVECLTRRQLFAEGVKFLYLALLLFLVVWAVGSVGDAVGVDLLEKPLGMGVTFVCFILSGIFMLGGVYLLLRGLFRSAGYVPPPHCGGAREPNGHGTERPWPGA